MQDIYISIYNQDGLYVGNIRLDMIENENIAQSLEKQAGKIDTLEREVFCLKQEIVELRLRGKTQLSSKAVSYWMGENSDPLGNLKEKKDYIETELRKAQSHANDPDIKLSYDDEAEQYVADAFGIEISDFSVIGIDI